MNRIPLFVLLLVSIVASAPVAAGTAERSSTLKDRESVNLTIYNGAMALVHDRRRIRLDNGLNRLAWRDVSANMDATSAVLQNNSPLNAVDVLEQNFNFDLLDPAALLQKSVGHDVIVVHEARFPGDKETRERARVLSANNGIVLQYKDRIESSVRGYIVYPALPPNFRDRPTLSLELQSEHAASQTLDLSYLTGGLSWHADYVGTISPDEKYVALSGLVTLSNTSGASYENARLQLVAGNVNVAPPSSGQLREIGNVTNVYAVNRVIQENYFEYHLYTLERPSTILDKQTKQLSLLSAQHVPIRKTLEIRGLPDYYRSSQPDLGDRLPVGVYVTFENKGGDLGIPLPAGSVRLYKSDAHGLSQFLGSDHIDHTPRNETVRLHVGNSFDVTARKRQTVFQNVGVCATESSYAITVSNAKSFAQDVLVVEPIPGDWQILAQSEPHTKSSASTASWNVHVPANGSTTLTYTARTTWC